MKLNTQFLLVSGFLTASGLAAPLEAEVNELVARNKCGEAVFNEYVFKLGLPTFMERSKNKDPSDCDWSNDVCSYSPDKPGGFNFANSCIRHDFGYRNSKKLKLWNEELRKRVDVRFREDLLNECSKYKIIPAKLCRGWAHTYYGVVRKLGHLARREEPVSIPLPPTSALESDDDFDWDDKLTPKEMEELKKMGTDRENWLKNPAN